MDEIVIAGISGRLPESNNLEEFWENLIGGVDMVTEDDRRWTPGETPHTATGLIEFLEVDLQSQTWTRLLSAQRRILQRKINL